VDALHERLEVIAMGDVDLPLTITRYPDAQVRLVSVVVPVSAPLAFETVSVTGDVREGSRR
jgi:hypothetical protein